MFFWDMFYTVKLQKKKKKIDLFVHLIIMHHKKLFLLLVNFSLRENTIDIKDWNVFYENYF